MILQRSFRRELWWADAPCTVAHDHAFKSTERQRRERTLAYCLSTTIAEVIIRLPDKWKVLRWRSKVIGDHSLSYVANWLLNRLRINKNIEFQWKCRNQIFPRNGLIVIALGENKSWFLLFFTLHCQLSDLEITIMKARFKFYFLIIGIAAQFASIWILNFDGSRWCFMLMRWILPRLSDFLPQPEHLETTDSFYVFALMKTNTFFEGIEKGHETSPKIQTNS